MHHLSYPAQTVKTIDRILQIVVAKIFDGLTYADCLFGGPGTVRIDADVVIRKCVGQSLKGFHLVIRMKDTGLQLMAGKSIFLFHLPGKSNKLIGSANFSFSVFIQVSPETVRGEWNAIPQLSTENGMHRYAPNLAKNIQASKFERCQQLSTVVVKRCGRVCDPETHFFEQCRVVADKVGLERPDSCLRGFPAPAHLPQADVSVVGLYFNNGPNESRPMTAVGVPQCGV